MRGRNSVVIDVAVGARVPGARSESIWHYHRRQDSIQVTEIAGGTDGSWTLRWREMDSNHRFRVNGELISVGAPYHSMFGEE